MSNTKCAGTCKAEMYKEHMLILQDKQRESKIIIKKLHGSVQSVINLSNESRVEKRDLVTTIEKLRQELEVARELNNNSKITYTSFFEALDEWERLSDKTKQIHKIQLKMHKLEIHRNGLLGIELPALDLMQTFKELAKQPKVEKSFYQELTEE